MCSVFCKCFLMMGEATFGVNYGNSNLKPDIKIKFTFCQQTNFCRRQVLLFSSPLQLRGDKRKLSLIGGNPKNFVSRMRMFIKLLDPGSRSILIHNGGKEFVAKIFASTHLAQNEKRPCTEVEINCLQGEGERYDETMS